ncbi:hypothetical protein EDB84DRAFT_509165, partial [Lactarius hengduanensis]
MLLYVVIRLSVCLFVLFLLLLMWETMRVPMLPHLRGLLSLSMPRGKPPFDLSCQPPYRFTFVRKHDPCNPRFSET